MTPTTSIGLYTQDSRATRGNCFCCLLIDVRISHEGVDVFEPAEPDQRVRPDPMVVGEQYGAVGRGHLAALIAALARSGSERPRRADMPLGSRNATSTKLCEIWCSAHESTDAAVCRSTRPPTTTTVVPARATSVDATDRAFVTTVSGRSAGSISARRAVASPVERRIEPWSGNSSRAACAM